MSLLPNHENYVHKFCVKFWKKRKKKKKSQCAVCNLDESFIHSFLHWTDEPSGCVRNVCDGFFSETLVRLFKVCLKMACTGFYLCIILVTMTYFEGHGSVKSKTAGCVFINHLKLTSDTFYSGNMAYASLCMTYALISAIVAVF